MQPAMPNAIGRDNMHKAKVLDSLDFTARPLN